MYAIHADAWECCEVRSVHPKGVKAGARGSLGLGGWGGGWRCQAALTAQPNDGCRVL